MYTIQVLTRQPNGQLQREHKETKTIKIMRTAKIKKNPGRKKSSPGLLMIKMLLLLLIIIIIIIIIIINGV